MEEFMYVESKKAASTILLNYEMVTFAQEE